ncbi:MAG: hypothetical protein JST30_10575 [Armatimonadetes bacterium]|nr:hypothetical protein [Armatimonadota bacterium]
METTALFRTVSDDARYQLEKSLEGLDESSADAKPGAHTMSARETLAHLAECYVAGTAHLEGGQHEWGTFKPKATDFDALRSETFAHRDRFCDLVSQNPTEDAVKTAFTYGSSHDFYHVGQLCSLRLSLDPSWDAYSIYKS